MPKFNDVNMEEHNNQGTGHYGFSAVKIEDLEATEFTLVTIVLDESGSTSSFRSEMEACIKEIIKACKNSPRADFLLLRLVGFGSTVAEIHGFLPLEQCNLDDYDDCCGRSNNGYSTALYDSAENAIESSRVYAEQLADQDYDVNGIVFIITDGDDNESRSGQNAVKDALAKCITCEKMESLQSFLIGVNVQTPYLAQYLEDFNRNVGFDHYEKLEDATEKTLARLAAWVSQSISSQSQALGTGGPSQVLEF